jgi:hypothetical protein
VLLPIVVPLPIGVVMLLIVGHHISKGETVMGSDKVDAVAGGAPPLPLAPAIVAPPEGKAPWVGQTA